MYVPCRFSRLVIFQVGVVRRDSACDDVSEGVVFQDSLWASPSPFGSVAIAQYRLLWRFPLQHIANHGLGVAHWGKYAESQQWPLQAARVTSCATSSSSQVTDPIAGGRNCDGMIALLIPSKASVSRLMLVDQDLDLSEIGGTITWHFAGVRGF